MFKKAVENEPVLTFILQSSAASVFTPTSGEAATFFETRDSGNCNPEAINTGNTATPLCLRDASGGWESNVVLRAWASLAGNGTRCCMCMGSRIHLWASNIRNVAVVVRSRVVFEEGGTHMVEPTEQSVEQEESQASLGMQVRKPQETTSQQKRVRVEFTEI